MVESKAGRSRCTIRTAQKTEKWLRIGGARTRCITGENSEAEMLLLALASLCRGFLLPGCAWVCVCVCFNSDFRLIFASLVAQCLEQGFGI